MSAELTTLFGIWTTALGATVYGLSATQSKCPVCRKGMVGPQDFKHASAELLGGRTVSEFPDWVGGMEKIVSERVIEDCLSGGLVGVVGHPIRVSPDQYPNLMGKAMPRYCLLEVTGGVDLNRQLYDEGEGKLCHVCRAWNPKPGGKYRYGDKVELPDLTTWDGSDFVRSRNLPLTYLYCSRSVVDLARLKQWSGFGVRAFTGTGHIKIDHSKENWFETFVTSAKSFYPAFF